MKIAPYLYTARMSMREQTNGGLAWLLPRALLLFARLVPLMLIWRVVMSRGVDVGMSLPQMLSYTLAGTLFAEQMDVRTMLTSWNYNGRLVSLYQRPMSVFGHVISQTVGGWIPLLLSFSLPLLLLAPLAGVITLPASPWFFASLPLGISLGFSVEFLFACLAIRLRGMGWLVNMIRTAIVSLLSGAVIPFRILPFGLERLLSLQPLGSLGGAPLSLFAGTGDPLRVLLLQVAWNLVLWPLAILAFRKSQERMMSYGG